jgi:hypothetical protein
MIHLLPAIGALAAVGGCRQRPSADDLTQVEVDHSVDACGGSREDFQANHGRLTRVQPHAREPDGVCVVEGVTNTGKTRLTRVRDEMCRLDDSQ